MDDPAMEQANRNSTSPPVLATRGRKNAEVRDTYDERLNHILEAATRVIASEGFDKASMRDVAHAAGVSLSGMYHYFHSKERMLFLIQFRTFNSLLHNLQEKLYGVLEPLEQLRVMIRAHVEYFAAHMPALKACSHELDSLSGNAYEETLSIRREYYQITRRIVDRIIETHRPAGALDGHVATMSLFGTLNWLYRWYEPGRGPSPSVLARQITAQFLDGIAQKNGSADGDLARADAPTMPAQQD